MAQPRVLMGGDLMRHWALFFIALLVLGIEWGAFRQSSRNHFEFHLRSAEEASRSGAHERAARHAVRAVAFRRNDGHARFMAARMLRRAELPTEAKPHLEIARQRLGDHPEIDLEQLLNAVQLGQASELVERALYERALRDSTNRILILEALAVAALAHYRIDKARALLDEWLKEESHDSRPYLWRGLALQQMGGYQEDAAIADFRRAVALNPNDEEARRRLGLLLIKKNAHSEAAEHFTALLAHRPSHVAAMVGLAQCKYALGEPETARALLTQALAIQPDQAEAQRELGMMLLNQGRTAEALLFLTRACELDPSDPYASYNLMQCLQQLGRDEEVQRQKAKHEALAARHERMQKLLAELQMRPKDADLLGELGGLYLQAGRADAEETGIWFLQQALQVSPKHQPSLQKLADFFERRGRHDWALEFRRKLR